MKIQMILQIEPVPKSVPRTKFVSQQVITYYPGKTTEALETIRKLIVNEHLEPFPPHIPLALTISFFRTKSRWLPRKETMPFRKPDLDNFCKMAIDCISHTLIPDDAQLTTIVAKKRWSPNNQGFIRIKLEEDKP